MINKLYKHRFEIFLISQITILFGSLLVPLNFYENYLLPVFYLLGIAAGILMISKQKKLAWFFTVLFFVALLVFGFQMISGQQSIDKLLLRLSVYFLFYTIVAWHIIKQVLKAKHVTKNVIMGLVSGNISLGFLAFFLFMSIHLTHSNAFSGALLTSTDINLQSESLLYYAFITLLTIGYGEIVPAIPIAQKAAILVGLVGQFYIVIITAVVMEKYIRHSASQNNS